MSISESAKKSCSGCGGSSIGHFDKTSSTNCGPGDHIKSRRVLRINSHTSNILQLDTSCYYFLWCGIGRGESVEAWISSNIEYIRCDARINSQQSSKMTGMIVGIPIHIECKISYCCPCEGRVGCF